MRVYNVEKVISKDGSVQLEGLPFPPGELVDVIVLARRSAADPSSTLALKDSVLKYDLPFEPVAEEDWDVKRLA